MLSFIIATTLLTVVISWSLAVVATCRGDGFVAATMSFIAALYSALALAMAGALLQ